MEKKTVLITGARGKLGLALVKLFLKNNFSVIATDINPGMPDELKSDKNFTQHKMDVTSGNDARIVADMVAEKYGSLDIVISNAAIVDYFPLSEAGSEQLAAIFDTNVLGLANVAKYFLPLLHKTKGRLIVISSESYKVPAPFQPYSVSKQVLEKLYGSIRLELLTKGIKTVLIRPGAIQTRILEDTLAFNYPLRNSMFKEEFDRFGQSIPKYIGKASSPEHVAKVIYKAATAARPKRIYKTNHNPLISLLSFLPGKLAEYLIIRNLKK